MKKLFFLLLLAASFGFAQAQTITSINDIKVTGSNVNAPNDTSLNYNGQEVTVRGVIVSEPEDWYLTDPDFYSNSPRSGFFLQDTAAPYRGIEVTVTQSSSVYSTLVSAATDLKGSLIQVTGEVGYFNGIIQLDLDAANNANYQLLTPSYGIQPDSNLAANGNVGLLNDNNQQAVASGDELDGTLVTIEDVTVSDVAFQGDRGRFTVTDQGGNVITIFDALLWQRNSTASPFDPDFQKPAVGATYTAITGVVRHFSFDDGDPGDYVIVPLDPSDLELGASPPVIDEASLLRDATCPTAASDVVITTTVTHPQQAQGTDSVQTVTLIYNNGGADKTVTMTATANPNEYSGTIPAADNIEGNLVYYYVQAQDFAGTTVTAPQFTAPCYTPRDAGCQIADIQRVPDFIVNSNFSDSFYESGYTGYVVSDVEGIVASTNGTDNLGRVFIIQEGATAWGGIKILGDNSVNNLEIGDRVRVTGTVVDGFDADTRAVTEIQVSSLSVVDKNNTLTPQVATTATFSGDFMEYNLEQYEGMLLRFEEAGLVVVNDAVDTAGGSSPHMGDYRVGTDENDPATGVRVAAGNVGSQSGTYSSLAVPYVRSADLASLFGVMTVTPCVVENGTTMDFVEGIMEYQYSALKLLPRDEDDFGNVSGCTTSREDFVDNSHLTMYPNPTTGKLTFNFSGEAAANTYTAQVVDMTGRTLVNTELTALGNAAELDLSGLQSGSYIVVLTGDNGARMSRPVIIAR